MQQTKVVYTVRKLTLKYLSVIATNPVDQIHVNLEIVATQSPTSGTGPWKRIFSKYIDTHVTLNAAAPATVLQNIIFTIPLPLFTQADSVGFDVNDAGIMWPFDEELK